MNMNNDCIFHMKWEDRFKKAHNIGILAKIEENYYLMIKDKENAKEAYENDFNGVPGFKTNKVYKSQELFSFFKDRLLKQPNMDWCEELRKTSAKSMTDSFFVEEMPEEEAIKSIAIILEADRLQEKIKKMMEEKVMEQ